MQSLPDSHDSQWAALRSSALDWFAACRPKHWAKNVLVLVPVVVSHQYFNVEAWFAATVTGAAFCVCASGIYLVNDVVDRQVDRLSLIPSRAERPIAARRIRLRPAIVGALGLVAGGVGMAGTVSVPVAVWVCGYVAAAVGYSVWIKRFAICDVVFLASMYMLRITAGAAAVGLSSISAWLFVMPLFTFFTLALAKRLGEIRVVEQQGRSQVPGRDWKVEDAGLVLALAGAFAAASVLATVLYAESTRAHAIFTRPEILWLASPVISVGLGRVLLSANRGEMGDDPVSFILMDLTSWAVFLVLAATFWAAL